MHWHVLVSPVVLSVLTTAQDVPAIGFRREALPFPGSSFTRATTTLGDGRQIVFDGLVVRLFDPSGELLNELGHVDEFVFPSWIAANPTENFVLFGESSTGEILSLSINSTSSPDLVATLNNNYDAVFRTDDELFVSAATCGFNCGNEIWRVNLITGATTLEARAPGASGPLAFDPDGNLYYGTASAEFPPPPKPSAVFRWTAAQIAGPPVDVQDAELVGGGFSGAAQMVVDPRNGALYLAENNFATGENRIRLVLGSADESPTILEGQSFLALGNLDFLRGFDKAEFLPHQPADGGALVYTTTDFFSVNERAHVVPRRPEVTFSGPGTRGPGEIEIALDSGPPNGFARVLYCPSALLPAAERAFVIQGVPLFVGLHIPSMTPLPGLVPLDAEGAWSATFDNPGGLEGQVAVQLLLIGADPHFAGTSAVGTF